MKREEIASVVIENIKLNIDGLEDVDIDLNKSMTEYGATSLDIVEIVSSSMRQLNLRIPRTELASAKTMSQLVDLFMAIQAKA